MRANACYLSNTGRMRSNNEDCLLVNCALITEADMENPQCMRSEGETLIYVAADGIGGHRRGEVASRTVLEAFRKRYAEIQGSEQVLNIIGEAKENLNRIAEAEQGSLGLGTTVSGIVLSKGKAWVFNCGDSRVYRRRKGILERITRDQSLVQELVDEGIISEEEMRTHPQKHIITSSVSGDMRHNLPAVSVEEMGTMFGDVFLICTDGVWESMSRAQIEKCLAEEEPEAAMRCLLRKVIESGARDNLSMIVVELVH